MVGWHHRLNGHEFEQAPGVGDGQGSLACCSPWGHRESDTTQRLNNSNNQRVYVSFRLPISSPPPFSPGNPRFIFYICDSVSVL